MVSRCFSYPVLWVVSERRESLAWCPMEGTHQSADVSESGVSSDAPSGDGSPRETRPRGRRTDVVAQLKFCSCSLGSATAEPPVSHPSHAFWAFSFSSPELGRNDRPPLGAWDLWPRASVLTARETGRGPHSVTWQWCGLEGAVPWLSSHSGGGPMVPPSGALGGETPEVPPCMRPRLTSLTGSQAVHTGHSVEPASQLPAGLSFP